MLINSLQKYIKAIQNDFPEIPEERKKVLQELAAFVKEKVQSGQTAELVFICTHNSRRSQMAQIWAQVAAYHYDIPGVKSYSGGTEVTAFSPRAVEAMRHAGLDVSSSSVLNNPVYQINYAKDAPPVEAFSKVYNSEKNPRQGFAAIMTCSHADENCPVVQGNSLRLPIRYKDPKEYDDTPLESQMYQERCRQIALEMFYAFSFVNTKE